MPFSATIATGTRLSRCCTAYADDLRKKSLSFATWSWSALFSLFSWFDSCETLLISRSRRSTIT